jgi:ribosomal protein L37AE/L43A
MTQTYRARKTGTEVVCPGCGYRAHTRKDRKSNLYRCFVCGTKQNLPGYPSSDAPSPESLEVHPL